MRIFRLVGAWLLGGAAGFLVLRLRGMSVVFSLIFAAVMATFTIAVVRYMYGGRDH